MTVVLELTQEELAALRTAAEAAGLKSVVAQIDAPSQYALSSQERERLLDELCADSESMPELATDAFSRAEIYRDHD